MRCLICGTRNLPESSGGTPLCDWCGIGDFGLARIQRQNVELRRLNEENDRLRIELVELKGDVV